MKLKNFFKTASNEIPRQMPDEPQKKGKIEYNRATSANIIIQVLCKKDGLTNVMQTIKIPFNSFIKYLDKNLSKDIMNMKVIHIDTVTNYKSRKYEKGEIIVDVLYDQKQEKKKED